MALSEAVAMLIKTLGGKRSAKKKLGDSYWALQWQIMEEEAPSGK